MTMKSVTGFGIVILTSFLIIFSGSSRKTPKLSHDEQVKEEVNFHDWGTGRVVNILTNSPDMFLVRIAFDDTTAMDRYAVILDPAVTNGSKVKVIEASHSRFVQTMGYTVNDRMDGAIAVLVR